MRILAGKAGKLLALLVVVLLSGFSGYMVSVLSAPPTSNSWIGNNQQVIGELWAGTLRGGSLTSGRVPFATTNGVLTDDTALTYNSATKTLGSGAFNVNAANVTATNMMTVPNDGITVGSITVNTDPLVYPESEADYTVWVDAGVYYAKNGHTGIVVSNVVATTLIQESIDSCIALGSGKIVFKPGIYRVGAFTGINNFHSTPYTLSKIIIEGTEGVIWDFGGVVGDLFPIKNSTGIIIRGIHFQNTEAVGDLFPVTNSLFILFEDVNAHSFNSFLITDTTNGGYVENVNLHRCRLDSMWYGAKYLGNTGRCNMNDVSIGLFMGTAGIYENRSGGDDFNTFTNVQFFFCTAGYKADYAQGTILDKCHFEGCTNDIITANTTSVSIKISNTILTQSKLTLGVASKFNFDNCLELSTMSPAPITNASGTATILANTNHLHVTHNLSYTPSIQHISLTRNGVLTNCTAFWIDPATITSTEFQVFCGTTAQKKTDANILFSWTATRIP